MPGRASPACASAAAWAWPCASSAERGFPFARRIRSDIPGTPAADAAARRAPQEASKMSQKVAYVTGGMGGIGTAICQRLHKDGFKVIAGCGPSRDHAKWIGEQKALGYTFYASVGNVADWESTVSAFKQAKEEHGVIDVLVNNAGITRD